MQVPVRRPQLELDKRKVGLLGDSTILNVGLLWSGIDLEIHSPDPDFQDRPRTQGTRKSRGKFNRFCRWFLSPIWVSRGLLAIITSCLWLELKRRDTICSLSLVWNDSLSSYLSGIPMGRKRMKRFLSKKLWRGSASMKIWLSQTSC